MRVIMGLAHLNRILRELPPGGRMLEWGCGGSTVWFAGRLPEGAELVSIEHDRGWHEQVAARLRDHPNVRTVLREPTGPLGRNATAEEDDPTSLTDFVRAPRDFVGVGPTPSHDRRRFDVILVDGYARGACLAECKDLLAPDGVVFLHDAQREWYDEPKQHLTTLGCCGSCADYPGPHLWWGSPFGHPAPRDRSAGELPVIVSSYTKGTLYEDEARNLIASCEALGLDHDVRAVEPALTWEAACARKPAFIADRLREHRRPVLWVDADAVVRRSPDLLRDPGVDFAVCRHKDVQLASGTVYFAPTPMAELLLGVWSARCAAEPDVYDQVHLDLAWEQVVREHPLATMWLPEPYTKIFDDTREAAGGRGGAVIEQFQASRRVTGPRTNTPRAGLFRSPFVQQLDGSFKAARRASRPRTEPTPDRAGPLLFAPAIDAVNMPFELKRLLVDRAALACVALGAKRIGIYGAGGATERIGFAPFTDRGLDVACIFDDAPTREILLGVPVFPTPYTGETEAPDVDAVVVISDRFERKLAAHARLAFGDGTPIIRLYEPDLAAESAAAPNEAHRDQRLPSPLAVG